jgi:hypothetical protein
MLYSRAGDVMGSRCALDSIVGCTIFAFVTAIAGHSGQNGWAATQQLQATASAYSTKPNANGFTPPVHLTTEEEHQREMDALHVASVRHGADGNADSPYAANYD